MTRRTQLPLVSELSAFEDDPDLFETSPEWFIPGLKPSLGEDEDTEDGERQRFRSLIEEPEVLAKAWQATESGDRTLRGGRRRRGTSRAADGR